MPGKIFYIRNGKLDIGEKILLAPFIADSLTVDALEIKTQKTFLFIHHLTPRKFLPVLRIVVNFFRPAIWILTYLLTSNKYSYQ